MNEARINEACRRWIEGERSLMGMVIVLGDEYADAMLNNEVPQLITTLQSKLNKPVYTVRRILSASYAYYIINTQYEDAKLNPLYYSHWACVGEPLKAGDITVKEAYNLLKQAVSSKPMWSVDVLNSKLPHEERELPILDRFIKAKNDLYKWFVAAPFVFKKSSKQIEDQAARFRLAMIAALEEGDALKQMVEESEKE